MVVCVLHCASQDARTRITCRNCMCCVVIRTACMLRQRPQTTPHIHTGVERSTPPQLTHLPKGETGPIQGSAYSLVACTLELAHDRDPLQALDTRGIAMRQVLAAVFMYVPYASRPRVRRFEK